MNKALTAIAVVLVILLATSSMAFAFNGYGQDCSSGLQDSLTGEERALFNEIIDDFKVKMTALRDQMRELREEGNRAALQALREERNLLMEEKWEALNEMLPEKFADQFDRCGKGMRKSGWDKGSGGFGPQ